MLSSNLLNTPNQYKRRTFSLEEIQRIINNPMLRLQNHPQIALIASQLMIEPNDPYLQEYFATLLGQFLMEISNTGDPLYANCPEKGSILTNMPAVSIGIMTTGDVLPIPLNNSASGTAITGLPGSGKTTLAMSIVIQKIYAERLVIVWDIKGTWKKLLYIPALANRIIVISAQDLKWSLLQNPPNTSSNEWANRFTNLIAQAYTRISAQRMLRQVIQELLDVYPKGFWPSLNIIIDKLKALQTKNFKDKEYVSSLLWVLTDIANHFPGCFEYTYSDFPEKLFNLHGKLIIIDDSGLPANHRNFIISLLWEWIFTYRLRNPIARNFNIIFVLEDSTSLLDRARDIETPGGVSLIAQNLNFGREMRIEIMPICHSLGQISPKILPNIDSFLICSLRGDDLRLAEQVLGINYQQAEFLRVNPIGTACALIPCVWPLPVIITFPKIFE